MQDGCQMTMPTIEVDVLFADHMASFDLSYGATLADLANLVGGEDAPSSELPTAIFLKFDATKAAGDRYMSDVGNRTGNIASIRLQS